MGGGFAGVEKRSSSVESRNKSELGLALAAGATGFVVLGFEENNSSSSWSSLNKSAPFLVTAGFAVELKQKQGLTYKPGLVLSCFCI